MIHWTIRSRVPAVMEAVDKGSEHAAETTREFLASTARELAPVLTGELRDSIEVQGDDVVVGAPHGIFNEYGTRFMSPQPFFTPAADRAADAFAGYMGAVFRGL